MIGPLKAIARRYDLKKRASNVPAGLIGMKDIRSAVIFVAADDVEMSRMVADIRGLFGKKGIRLDIYAFDPDRKQHFGEANMEAVFIHRNNVNWYGRIRRNKRTPVIEEHSDLFISLLADPLYPVEREALCNSARIKMGRHSPEIYNIVVEDAQDTSSTQREAFGKMWELLQKIV